jgi:hypothetical protein
VRGSAEDRAEAAARLESKGLASSGEAVDALLGLADGSREGAHEGGGQGSPGSQPPGAGLLPDPDVDPEGFARELGRFIKKLCTAAADDASAGMLGLANHARSRGEDLLEIPFHFSLDRVAFAGSFRILLPYMPSGPGRFDARFIVSREGEEEGARGAPSGWAFSLRTGGAEGKKLLVLFPPSRVAERLLPAFRAELERMGCAVKFGGQAGPEPSGKIDLDA